MATIEFIKTPFDQNFTELMKVKYFYDLPQGYSDKVLASIVKSIAKVLHEDPKKNEGAHGIYYPDLNDQNKKMFAGILEYDKNEENPENPGAYEYTLSYDPEITCKAEKSAQDPRYSEILANTLLLEYGISIVEANSRYVICSSILDYLKQFVENQVNNNPDETIELDIPGIMLISGGIEDNAIVISILPGADLKSKAVKDDAASEKA